MRKILNYTLLFLLFLLISCGGEKDLTENYRWATFSDPSGFSIQLPEHWLVAPQGNTPMTLLTALIPAEDSLDQIQERVTVTRKRRTMADLPDIRALRQANESSIRQAFPDIEILRSEEIRMPAGGAYIIDSRLQNESKQWHLRCIVRKEWTYTLSYAASTKTYDNYIKAIEKSFDSFTFDQQI